MPTTSYSSWDFYNYHVQQDLVGGQFVSAETTLVAAGPPQLSQISGGPTAEGGVFPIGLLETVGLQQSKQLQRIFEIGSIRSYFVPGRTIGSLSIGRTFYFGPSLLRVLYAYYRNNNTTKQIFVGNKAVGAKVTIDGQSMPDPQAALLGTISDPNTLHQLRRTPGDGFFFVDLASDLFAQPTGMAIYFKDANETSLGGMYLQDCYVQGHQMNISSGSVLIMEGVSMQYDTMAPFSLLPSG